MIDRLITQRVLRDFNWSPIVGLIGSRQVGKTTLAGYHLVKDLQPQYKYVITPSGECFDRHDGLRICPLNIFLEKELPMLL